VAETRIKVTADTAQAERQLKNLEKAIEGLDSVSSAATKALAGIAAAGAAMGYAIAKTLDSVDELAKTSKQLGMSAADLQAFRNSAALAGVGTEELTASLRKLQVNIGDALIKGTGPAKDALDRLGISMKDLQGLGADQQFQRIAAEIAKIPDPAQRSAVAMDLLGKQGPRLLEAATELERLRKEAELLGIALTDVDTAAIERAGDAITEIQQIFAGALQKAVADLAPMIEYIAKSIKSAIMEAGGFEAVWQQVKSAIRQTANVALILVGIVTVAKLASGALALYRAIVMAGSAMAAFNALVRKNPLLLAVGAALLLAKVLGVDVVGYMDDYLGLSKGAADVVNDIKDDLKVAGENQQGLTQGAEEFNQAQKKALDALGNIVTTKNNEISALRTSLSISAEEAAIKKAIGEQEQKLLEAKVNLTDVEAQSKLRSFEISVRQEELLKRIIDRQKEVNNAVQGMMDPDEYARIEAWGKLQKAQEDYIQSLAFGDQIAIKSAKSQMDILDIAFENQIIKTAKSKVQRLKIEQDYIKQIQNIEANQRNLLAISLDEESDLYKALEEEKLRIKAEYTKQGLELELQQFQNSLMTKETMEFEHQEKLFAIREAAQQKTMEMNLRMGKAEHQYRQFNAQESKQIAAERSTFEQKTEAQKAQFVIQQGADMFSALGAHNKKAFEAAKAFNIANAIMNTYMGATKALATYPPPFNFIAAAAVIGMGLAQVATIRNQQYSGRQLGGPVMGGTTYMVGENGPELFTPNTTGSITRNGDLGGGGDVQVNFTIVANDTQGFDQLLTSRQGVIKQIISDAMLERGQRSMV
jgi:hypothetical protein